VHQWLVTEFAPLGDLTAYRFRHEAHAWIAFHQLTAALRLLHRRGLAHLDVSLENCVMADEHSLKVCDFGQARPYPVDANGHELPFVHDGRFVHSSVRSPSVHHVFSQTNHR
jgi:serine/threonine protein kinase